MRQTNRRARWAIGAFRLMPAVLAALAALAPCSMATAAPTTADAQAGKQKAQGANCFECHGENGMALSSGYPHLAGQHPAYLAKQLADFRSGARKSPFMNIVAARLEQRDLADIAAYFASLPRTATVAAPAPAPPASASASASAAARLYQQGDGKRGIAACAQCHGATGAGSADGAFPALAGQQMFYLREQLLNWHLGLRNNSPARTMNKASDALSESEIDALASYMAGM